MERTVSSALSELLDVCRESNLAEGRLLPSGGKPTESMQFTYDLAHTCASLLLRAEELGL